VAVIRAFFKLRRYCKFKLLLFTLLVVVFFLLGNRQAIGMVKLTVGEVRNYISYKFIIMIYIIYNVMYNIHNKLNC